jgi:hypothetical protein
MMRSMMSDDQVTAAQLDEALTLTYKLAHACNEPADYRLWSALIKLAPSGVVQKRALELRKDQLAERAEMRAAARKAVLQQSATKRPLEFMFKD